MLLTLLSYDAIGRLATESAGDPTVANRVYRYDIRSHPISISSYGYSQQLSFTYGGNVSTMTWKAYGPEETEHTYRFEYDGLSRLVAARHSDSDGHSGLYDTSYSYDLNGNITSLTRSGLYDSSPYGNRYGSIDDLTYEYSGNQVTRISDLCTGPFYQGAYHFRDGADEEVEYTYDANGNMTMDLNRGITSISYDINQRPRSVVFDSGASTSYLYSADGVKLQTRHRTPTLSPAAGMGVANESTEESVTDYCGPFIYEDGELTRINLENGYLSYRSYAGQRLEVPEYVFYLRDHLGNNRVTMSANGGIYQIDHFYPFGLPMGCSYNSSHQQWRFGGKELDRTAGLDLYDFEARAYDPSTARFTRPDDLSEKYHPISPMVFCLNNPLIFRDPTGMAVFYDGSNYLGTDGVNDNLIYLLKTTNKNYTTDGNSVPAAHLSKKEQKAAKVLFQDGILTPGSSLDAFVCITLTDDAINTIVDHVSHDDGTGGTSDNNNREYGGTIRHDGGVDPENLTTGDVSNPIGEGASVTTFGVRTFHSHPSGTIEVNNKKSTTTHTYMQHPSPSDIDNAFEHISIVFGRGEGKVYLYNNTGIQAETTVDTFRNIVNLRKPAK